MGGPFDRWMKAVQSMGEISEGEWARHGSGEMGAEVRIWRVDSLYKQVASADGWRIMDERADAGRP